MKSRRQFLKLAGTGALAAGALSLRADPVMPVFVEKPNNTFNIGIAGFTFREFSVEKTLEMMKRVGLTNISLKEFHAPLNSTQEQINVVLEKFKSAGINVYSAGGFIMKTKESVDQVFEYTKMAGIKMIIGAPDPTLLSYVEQKLKIYGFKLAIYTHGPDTPPYPDATTVWDFIKDMDQNMGICIDIGHITRCGKDPSADITRYSKRIFDVNIKDVDKASKEGKTVEMGRGIIDIPGVVETLRKIRYTGICSLKFEKDSKDPLPGIAESIGYLKGVMACD
jgi:inosose dehydratase